MMVLDIKTKFSSGYFTGFKKFDGGGVATG